MASAEFRIGSVKIRNLNIPLTGLGTTVFWEDNPRAEKTAAYAMDRGIRLFDCAQMYGNGRCEETLGRLLSRRRREEYFLVDKILPGNADRKHFAESLETSLQRLGTDYIDLYLLHWREHADLEEVSVLMHEAQSAGKIRAWGVSNFDVRDMEDLSACTYGKECAVDQILYNIGARGCEFDLLPWLREHDVLPMAYSSLGSSFTDTRRIAEAGGIRESAERKGIPVTGLMLRFVTEKGIPAVFSTSSIAHLEENLAGQDMDIHDLDDEIDRLFPAPDHKVPLAKL